jgi:hypothetical protein
MIESRKLEIRDWDSCYIMEIDKNRKNAWKYENERYNLDNETNRNISTVSNDRL